MSGLLALVVAWTYKNFRKNTASEIDVMAGMFSPVPQRWDRVEGRRQLKWLTAMWVGVSLLLVWFLNHPRLYSATVMVYSGCNVYGMVLYRRNISRYFDDKRFLRAKDNKHKGFIKERRRIQSIYLDKHHHVKEVMLFTGAAAAFVTTTPSMLPIAFPKGLPTIILLITMSLNEIVVERWRRQRESALIRVEAKEIKADIHHTGE